MDTAGPFRQLHATALQICKDLEPTVKVKAAKGVVKDYNKERKENTAKLKLVLAEMDQRFNEGEVIAGSASMKQWCEVHKNAGALSYARVRQILTGKTGNESKVKSQNSLDQFLAHVTETKAKLAEIQRQTTGLCGTLEKAQERTALEKQVSPTVWGVVREFLTLITPEGSEISQGDSGKWHLSEKRSVHIVTPEEQKAKRSAAAKKAAAATRAAKEAIDPYDVTEIAPSEKETAELLETFGAQPTDAPAPTPDETEDNKAPTKTKSRKKARVAATPQEMEQRRKNAEAWKAQRLAQPMGECEGCNEAPATERVTGTYSVNDYCVKCAADDREYRRKQLVREMGVAKVCGKFWSWKSLPDEPRMMDDGKGGTFEMWSKRGYLERLKRDFLGNAKHDQAVVTKYVAEIEKKMGALDDPAKSVKPKVHFITEEVVVDGQTYGRTLACRPGTKPKPTQLTTDDREKVTCAKCVLCD